MVNNKKCKNCESDITVKNGFTNPDKFGRKKQKYLCTKCKKNFVEKKEALSRTEKRLFSLLLNLITYPGKESDTLKTIANICNKEVKLIGKLTLQMTKEKIELNKLENVCLAICFNKKENEIKIIKTYPNIKPISEIKSYTLTELSQMYQNYLEELLGE